MIMTYNDNYINQDSKHSTRDEHMMTMMMTTLPRLQRTASQRSVLPCVDTGAGRHIPRVHSAILWEVALVLQQMSRLRSPTQATHIRHHLLPAKAHHTQLGTLLQEVRFDVQKQKTHLGSLTNPKIEISLIFHFQL